MKYLQPALVVAAFIGGLIFIGRESTHIDNTLGGIRLFWYGAATGLGCALAISLLAIRGASRAERVVQSLMLMVGLTLLASAGASFINRNFSPVEQSSEKFVVLKKGQSRETRRSPAEYYLYLQTRDGEERVQVSSSLWYMVQPSATVTLSLLPGYFKFPYMVQVGR